MFSSAPLGIVKQRLGIDRVIYDEWVFGRDHSRVTWKKLDDLQFPLIVLPYVDTLTDIVFAGFNWERSSDGPHYRYVNDPASATLDDIKNECLFFYQPVIEVLCNAFLWGNKGQKDSCVQVKVFEGKNGRLLQVIDQGDGFDYGDVIKKFQAGEVFWHHQGNGSRTLASNPLVHLCYAHHGSSANLAVPFPDGIAYRSIGVKVA
ncbi:MAG: hypothetical protein Q7R96_00260 [Nanoarchaeota archaeon]|nr:hypothetical protein [Nanoarchaeota archaeon]